MYRCNSCSAVFDEPFVLIEPVQTDLGSETYFTNTCPHCGEDHFEEVDECRCGGYKPKHRCLCKQCREVLLVKFKAFADGLTAEEEAQLDEWLDGDSVTCREKFS